MYKLLVAMSMILLLAGCNLPQKDRVDISNRDNNTDTQVTQDSNKEFHYSDVELSEIMNYSGTKDELLSLYHTNSIQSFKVLETGKNSLSTDDMYRVIFRGETKILLLEFDSLGNKLSASLHNATLCRTSFETLTPGQTLSDVEMLDPDGEYIFLHTGKDTPRKSSHYTVDGFIINITYDANYVITKINIESM